MSETSVPHPVNGNGNGNGGSVPDFSGLQRIAVLSAFVGIAAYAVLALIYYIAGEPGAIRQCMLSWLTAFIFWLSLPIGGLALLGITYVTGASWGVLLSRFFEAATRTLPLLAVLAAPLVISLFIPDASPYPWSKPASAWVDEVAAPELQQKFNDWCNPPGFAIRMVIYFAIWGILIYFMNRWSVRVEQTNDMYARRYTENLSGPVIVCFALGNMFVCTDLVISIEINGSSTMFPVIFCINQLLTCLCLCVALFLTFAHQPAIAKVLRPKFQIDMGSMTLALTLVWSYVSFCQFLLIWVGNLPEEIGFYLKRVRGDWQFAARALCVFHFALPFLLLLFRDVKLHPKRLRAVAVGIMIMCAVDVLWWIEPAYQHGSPLFLAVDAAALVGMGGLWGLMFLNQLKKQPLLPTNYIGQLPGAEHGH